MGRRSCCARRCAVVLLAIGAIALCVTSSAVTAVEFWPKTFKLRKKGSVEVLPSVATLAEEIDWLERHIDTFGTVVAKEPDVWGEARLTKYRQEFEEVMAEKLRAFEVQYSAALKRSDAAYLGFAMALQAAAGNGSTAFNNPSLGLISSPTGTTVDPASKAQPTNLIPRTEAFGIPATVGGTSFSFGADTKLSLEPNIVNDELADYLRHLHELRRINEGDDNADAPGYSLNLVRIPISVLTGKKTRKGCGAEITISATPYLGEELLPVTFRGLVTNDVVDQLVQPLYMMVLKHDRDVLVRVRKRLVGELQQLGAPPPRDFEAFVTEACTACEETGECACEEFLVLKVLNRHEIPRRIHPYTLALIEKAIADCTAVCAPLDVIADNNCEENCTTTVEMEVRGRKRGGPALRRVSQTTEQVAPGEREPANDPLTDPNQRQLTTKSVMPSGQGGSGAVSPIAISQILRLFDPEELEELARQLAASLPDHNYRETLLDIYVWLRGETAAAYEMVAVHPAVVQDYVGRAPAVVCVREDGAIPEVEVGRPEGVRELQRFLWEGSYLKELADAIRSNNMRRATVLHDEFRKSLRCVTECERISIVTDLLAWAVTYDSAVLNDHLVRDIRETTSLKGCGCMQQPWLPFYGPNPPPESRQAFAQYVGCRWPLHIFALDPVIDQQNIADAFSRRREMQLALSMGFMSGQVGPGAMMNYARRLEWDMATVALNRTVVGFSHGGSTFGWRFMPRFQTPDIKGTLETVTQLIAGGPSRDCDRCDLELEPGMRECVAIVLMPSFVPSVVFETRSNWFRLTDPKKTALTMEQTVRLSRSVKTMQMAQEGISDQDLYRDGELDRMMTRVRQLSEELPMQTMRVEVPTDNFESGGEILAHGRAELMPVLYGWYGAPGVKLGDTTTLFLLGKNFSIHETLVTVGNRPAGAKLLSRNIMQITVPDNVRAVMDPTLDQPDYVDLHLATPYGVTSHIEIPVVGGKTTPDAGGGATWSKTKQTVTIRFLDIAPPPTPPATQGHTTGVTFVGFDFPPEIAIKTPTLAALPTVSVTVWIEDAKSNVDPANPPAANSGPPTAVISVPLTLTARLDLATRTYRIEGPEFKKVSDEIKRIIEITYSKSLPPSNPKAKTFTWYLHGYMTLAAGANLEPITGSVQLDVITMKDSNPPKGP